MAGDDVLAHLITGQQWQVAIKDDRFVLLGLQEVYRGLAVMNDVDRHACAVQPVADGPGQDGLILRQQNSHTGFPSTSVTLRCDRPEARRRWAGHRSTRGPAHQCRYYLADV